MYKKIENERMDRMHTETNLRKLPVSLKNNRENNLKIYMQDGEIVEKKFCEIHSDAMKVAAKIKETIPDMLEGNLLIMGEQSYEWIISALAGIYLGMKVIAFPETLSEQEAENCLNGISFTFCCLQEKFFRYQCFSNTQKFMLSKEMLDSLSDTKLELCAIPQPKLIAFTSGTTSALKLKAFQVNTESTECFFDSFVRIYGLTHSDNWAICHSFTHIVHFEYVLGALAWGMNLSLVKPLYLIWNFKEVAPNVLVTVPVVYQQLATYIKMKFPKNGEREEELARHFLQNITETNCYSFLNHLLPEVKKILGDSLKMMLIGTAPSSEELKRFLLLCGLPIYEGYGLSETNMLTCNRPDQYCFGSVGVAWPNVELEIEDGELKSKLNFNRCNGYINAKKEEEKAVFSEDGWTYTGDVSEEKDGFIFISGRIKDTIITDRGKNINPNPIEEKLKFSLNVPNVVLYGDKKSYLIAIITQNQDSTLEEEAVKEAIKQLNLGLGEHEKVKKFILTKQSFTIENGLLTRSGKVRRKLIWEKFKREISECYD